MDISFYGFAVFLFAAVILAVEGFVLWWSATRGGGAERIANRLRLMSGGKEGGARQVSILKQRRLARVAAVERLLARVPRIDLLDRLLQQSGLSWTVSRLIQLILALPLMAWVGASMLRLPPLASALLIPSAGLLPYLQVLRARTERMRTIEQQLPEAADFLARALRAGHAFTNALQMIGEEFPEPISGEFRATYEEINYGVPMPVALTNLASRVPLTDLRYLVIAVLIQRESGGNLAELLTNIGRIIRDRLKLMGQIRVLSAEGRMSAWVLGVLPWLVALAIQLSKPAYLATLWQHPTGIRLLWGSIGMTAFAVLWMRSIIRIRI
jgi:tight adherence protein B